MKDKVTDDGEYDLAFIDKDRSYYYYVNIPYYKNFLWRYCEHGEWSRKVEKHPLQNPWHYMTSDEDELRMKTYYDGRGIHPNTIAGNASSSKCASMHGGGSGRGPEFDVMDIFMQKGLVRKQATKEIIVPPEVFKCIYCGDVDWKKIEAESNR